MDHVVIHGGRSDPDTLLKQREAKKGFGDNVPKQGMGQPPHRNPRNPLVNRKVSMKKKDIIIIAAALVLALGLYLLSQIAGGETATTVVVTVDGKEVLRRPLAVENTYEIKQEDGSVNVIAVEGGAVYMKEANCRDGLCIAQGKMKNAAKTIVCLPHKLVVQLEGDSAADEQDELDVIIQ